MKKKDLETESLVVHALSPSGASLGLEPAQIVALPVHLPSHVTTFLRPHLLVPILCEPLSRGQAVWAAVILVPLTVPAVDTSPEWKGMGMMTLVQGELCLESVVLSPPGLD